MNFKEIKEYFELLKYSGIEEMVVSNQFEASISNLKRAKRKNTDKDERMKLLKSDCLNCQKCILSKTRNNVVFGEGNIYSNLLIVGEAPGAEEDLSGKVFVGKAGQLLTKMLNAIEINRDDVFIANILKCRPPENRNPKPIEVENCLPYLESQIDIIKPIAILLFGRVAATNLLKIEQSLGSFRLRIFSFKNIPVFVTYHPSALLRNPNWKKNAWEDLKFFKKHFDALR
jgi:DNA polymerase